MAGTIYPTGIDGFTQLPLVSDGTSPIRADDINLVRDAIVAVETELGINPSGTFGTTKDRLEAIDTLIGALTGTEQLSADQVTIEDIDGYFDDGYVEGALRELAAAITALPAGQVTVEDVDGYFDSATAEGVFQDIGASLSALPADQVTLADIDGYFASSNVEGALDEVGESILALKTDFISGHIETAADKAYHIGTNVPYGGTINTLTTRSEDGYADGYVTIEGVSLGGGTNSITISEDIVSHSTANLFAVGNDIDFFISNNFSATDVRFTVTFERT